MRYLVISFFIIIISFALFSAYQYRQEIARAYINHYISKKVQGFEQDLSITFGGFKTMSEGNKQVLFLQDISLALGKKEIGFIKNIQFDFKFGFLFTSIKLTKVTLYDAVFNIDFKTINKKTPQDSDILSSFVSVATTLDTSFELENFILNNHLVRNAFIKSRVKNKEGVLNVKINEDNSSDIEIEISKFQKEIIAIKIQSFNFNKSIFSEFIRSFSNIDLSDEDLTINGYAIIDLVQGEINGYVDQISGFTKNRLVNGDQFRIDKGEFKFIIANSAIKAYDIDICIDESQYVGKLEYNNNSYLLDGIIKNFNYSQVLNYWPIHQSQKARLWYQNSIKGGFIKSANILINEKLNLIEINNVQFKDCIAKIKEEELDLDIFNASGVINFVNNNLTILLHSAEIFNTNIHDFIIDISEGKKYPIIKIMGSAEDDIRNLSLISNNVIKKQLDYIRPYINFDKLSGNARVALEIKIADEFFDKNIKVNFFHASFADVLSGINVKNANLSLIVDNEKVSLEGDAFSGENKFNISISNNYSYKTEIVLDGMFSLSDLESSSLIPKLGFISGNFQGKFRILALSNDGLKVDGDGILYQLRDKITPMLGWNHEKDAKFEIALEKRDEVIDLKKLSVIGEQINISGSGFIGKKDSAISFRDVKVGDSIFDIQYQSKKNKSDLMIDAKILDLSQFSSTQGWSSGKSNFDYTLCGKIDKIKLKNNIFLADSNFYLDGEFGYFTANFSDQSLFNLKYNNAHGIDLDITNAGTFLKSLNLTNSVIGGRASAHLNVNPLRNNEGVVHVDGFFIKDAPSLAQILSLASLTGAMSVLNGEGIYFDQSSFYFKYGEGTIEFKESWFEGPSLGISAKGIISIPENSAVIHGSVVPLYQINKLIWSLPVLGPIVTGGGKSRGVVAAEYSVIKNNDKFDVSVNTLTALTPTMLRKFLDVFAQN